jgi:hypothetical protein
MKPFKIVFNKRKYNVNIQPNGSMIIDCPSAIYNIILKHINKQLTK